MRAWIAAALAGLLAGCVTPEVSRFPPVHETRTADLEPEFPGLWVQGTLKGEGPEIGIDAVAVRGGPRPYRVSSICTEPWGESMQGRFGRVHHREPLAVCMALGHREMDPGERIPYPVVWNGTLWDSQAQRFAPAPAGEYTWRVSFEFFAGGGDGGDPWDASRYHLHLDFPVTVE